MTYYLCIIARTKNKLDLHFFSRVFYACHFFLFCRNSVTKEKNIRFYNVSALKLLQCLPEFKYSQS